MTVPTIVLLIFLGIMLLSLPKKVALIPLLLGTCYVTVGPRLVIAGADFTVNRLLAIFGIIRVISRSEYKTIILTKLDKLIIIWTLYRIISGTLLHGNMDGFINRSGLAFDTICMYFLVRSFINRKDELVSAYKSIAIVFIPLSIFMLLEMKTGRNMFSVFGGVNEFSAIRNGAIRANGPFLHSILAGSAAASVLPYVSALWNVNSKKLCLISLFSVMAIVVTCHSSGPIMSLVFSLIGMSCWVLRDSMKKIRVMIYLSLIMLEIFMEAHVWYLIARIDLTGGSTGFHRALLISRAIEHFHEWWLLGTTYTRHWMPTGVSWSPNHTDITNHYILMGVNGGLGNLLLFVMLIIYGFKYVGIAVKNNPDFESNITIWAIGSALFCHAATFISVAYFDQSVMFIYLTLAMASSVYCLKNETHHELCSSPVNCPG